MKLYSPFLIVCPAGKNLCLLKTHPNYKKCIEDIDEDCVPNDLVSVVYTCEDVNTIFSYIRTIASTLPTQIRRTWTLMV